MKTKKNLIKFAAIFLLLTVMTLSFVACNKDEPVDPNGENVTKLSLVTFSPFGSTGSSLSQATKDEVIMASNRNIAANLIKMLFVFIINPQYYPFWTYRRSKLP